jgi:hypothetical protein
MKGYLLKNQEIVIGQGAFIESNSLENNFVVIFEDDGDTGYFYGAERNALTAELRILDMLHVYDVGSIAEGERKATLSIIWSPGWMQCALVINSYCHALFDFAGQGGYNRNQFPPPSDIWTLHERKLTDELIAGFFG